MKNKEINERWVETKYYFQQGNKIQLGLLVKFGRPLKEILKSFQEEEKRQIHRFFFFSVLTFSFTSHYELAWSKNRQ